MAMRSSFTPFLLLCIVSNLVSGTTRDYFDAKLRLMGYLTNNSLVKEILPARDIKTPVHVNVNISLRQITNVDEKHQTIRLTVWLRLSWNNPFLTWDPAEYGGIESVHANHELFWVPDVVLFNEATEEGMDILYKRLDTKLVIDKHGDCWWNVPTTLLSQCKIDVSRFPFDKQECHVSIGSWTYSDHEMNMTCFEQNADLSNFIENGEWKVESALLYNRLRHYNYYGEMLPNTDVTLTLKIKRRTLYYWLNIIVPPTIIIFLSLLSFFLPSDNGERITLVVSTLLALTVYMLIASSFLPETSDAFPSLVLYYLGIFCTMSLCLCATCLTLKFQDITWTVWRWLEVLIKLINKVMKNEKYTEMEDTASWRPNESNTEEVHSEERDGRRSKEEEERKKRKTAANVLDRFFLLLFSVGYVGWVVFLLSVSLAN